MVLREVIAVLLISGSLAVEFDDEKITTNQDFYVHQKKHYSSSEDGNENKFKDSDARRQFEKDYNSWSDKKYVKQASEEHKGDSKFMKINEIDDNEYVDKYNKYGKTFNPNIINFKREKLNHHDKHDSEYEKREKNKSLLHDIDVNYINNNKKNVEDSELITVNVFKNKENYQENFQNGKETYMKRYKKNLFQNVKKIDLLNPPINDTVLMARFIVHSVDWAALATLSGRGPNKGAPFVCVKATSDGMVNASTGVPLFYMSSLDLCTQDLQKDNRVSVLVTLSETEYCKDKNLDPQDPRCAKLTLSGKIKKIKPGSDEEKLAKNALFSRHPAMATWPSDHNWYFTKLKIGQIILLDKFGGATYIKVKDYLNGGITEPKL